MITICPKCALTLTVTASDLRIAQGHVRCGRCSSVFNALAALFDEAPTDAKPAARRRPDDTSANSDVFAKTLPALGGATPSPVLQAQEPAPAPESPREGPFHEPLPEDLAALADTPVTIDDLLPPAAAADEPANDPDMEDAVAANEELLSEEIVFESELAGDQEEAIDESLAIEEPTQSEAPQWPADRASGVAPDAATIPPVQRRLIPTIDLDDEGDEDGEFDAVPRRWRLAQRIGVPLLSLLLAGQVVHAQRGALAVHAAINGPLTALYAALGLPLIPDWDIRAYEVRQLGAVASPEAGSRLSVRASVRNLGSAVQPAPLLRIILTDRFGDRIAARDFTPREWVRPTTRAGALMAPGALLVTDLALVDPVGKAEGFELDACLPLETAQVRCANDAPPSPAR